MTPAVPAVPMGQAVWERLCGHPTGLFRLLSRPNQDRDRDPEPQQPVAERRLTPVLSGHAAWSRLSACISSAHISSARETSPRNAECLNVLRTWIARNVLMFYTFICFRFEGLSAI